MSTAHDLEAVDAIMYLHARVTRTGERDSPGRKEGRAPARLDGRRPQDRLACKEEVKIGRFAER